MQSINEQNTAVIITGGASGIGLATAVRLAGMFNEVHIIDLKQPQTMLANFIYHECDVSNFTAMEHIFKRLHARNTAFKGLICSAGILESNRLENSSAAKIEQVIAVNLLGTIYTLKLALPLLQQQTQSNIVLVASDQSFVGKPNNSIYGCTKAAISQLAKSMAIENAEFNIRVNAVCPGTIDTPFYQAAVERYAKRSNTPIEQVTAEEANAHPVKRIGQSDEVAELIEFLMTDKAKFMTGALIPIDGGYTAQ